MIRRDVVEVTGADALSYLQGQLSQDVAALADGTSALSFLLQPQGKVDALVRVTRVDGERFRVDVDEGWGQAVVERLSRFKLRVECEVASAGTEEMDAPWDGRDDERGRVEARFPAMGAELDERTIPAETGLVERAVSFTKGCYTGQELVARIDSRGGHVPRVLRRLELAADVPVGAALEVDGKERGRVTSVAGDAALAYVHRDVEPPAEAVVRWDDGETTARVT